MRLHHERALAVAVEHHLHLRRERPTAVTGSESVFHEKRLAVAVAMYFDPPHSSFDDRDDVSDEKSARSCTPS